MSQRKWLTEADEYVCTLSEETQQIAKEELREDKHTREQALNCVRDWIKNNPRILNCRLGNVKHFLYVHVNRVLPGFVS